MSTPVATYTYDKLQGQNTLRLLKLRPASHGDIDCELTEFELTDGDYRDSLSPSSPHVPKAESYEAVSWCWGREPLSRSLRIHRKDQAFLFRITPNLELALRSLRRKDRARLLWIDAICINQNDMKERNEQVPKMNKIYGQARNVCIWVGEADDKSEMALEFIRTRVLSLWEFDDLCKNPEMSKSWDALVSLMRRPWFSRRWVVQEIALAKRGTLYCGKDSISWQDFADAVSLFVEVESATHRLSEVMRRDEKFYNIPDFFGHVPELGAALLVDATSNLFRSGSNGKREPLLSLEYLVSKYSVFEATQPRDTIYALLAIAKDTIPQAKRSLSPLPRSKAVQQQLEALGRRHIASEAYRVDYALPVVEVYKDFIDFSIRKSEPTRALDILCRPWAPRFTKSADQVGLDKEPNGNLMFGIEAHIQHERRGSEIEAHIQHLRRGSEIEAHIQHLRRGSEIEAHIQHIRRGSEIEETLPLPSWIADKSGTAFTMFDHRTAGLRMERRNADPLVGLPGVGQRNYSAAGTRAVTMIKPQFKRRKRYYSMFVEGFILDEVKAVYEVARLGNIPSTWLQAGGWPNTNKDPPQEFWRTLVADRGPNGRNPPSFYPRACKESVANLKLGGTLDTRQLIHEGRCTIVAEFLRRVQAVIWNRCLMRTREGRLGLANENVKEEDCICVLYGCSVPVVLRKVPKTKEDMYEESIEEEREIQKRRETVVKLLEANRKRQLENRAEARKSDDRVTLKTQLGQYLTYLRFAWLIFVIVYIAWLHLGFEAAIVANSFVVLSSRLQALIRRGIPSEKLPFGHILEFPLDYAKITWLALLYALIQKCNHVGIKAVLISASIVVPFPQLLLSSTEARDLTISSVPVVAKTPKLKERSPVEEPEQFYWKLISDCYVHGVMDGEAITWQNNYNVKPQVFELR
jgi:Heterokaryon incompatibility protein (HET)